MTLHNTSSNDSFDQPYIDDASFSFPPPLPTMSNKDKSLNLPHQSHLLSSYLRFIFNSQIQ